MRTEGSGRRCAAGSAGPALCAAPRRAGGSRWTFRPPSRLDAAGISRSRVAVHVQGPAAHVARGRRSRTSAALRRRRAAPASLARGPQAAAALAARRDAAGIDAIPWFDAALSAAARLHPRSAAGALGPRLARRRSARPAVAIVGSRAATPYALEVAPRLGAELAGRGIVVVSGLARGVDSAAHRGCARRRRRRRSRSSACGPDRVYPPEHAELGAKYL